MNSASRSSQRFAAASIALVGLAGALHAQATEQWQLIPSVGTSSQRFGYAMVVKGDVMVVGAPYDDTNGTDSGAVQVLRWDATTSTWQLEQQLFASDPENSARFGSAVDVSGNLIVVGAPYKDTTQGTDGGQTYVFRYNAGSGTWAEEQKLIPSVGVANDHFGAAVAVSGNLALFGAPQSDTTLGTDSGSVFAFRYKNSFLKWVEEKQILDGDGAAYDVAGQSVVLEGSTAYIASENSRESNFYGAGSVAIWTVSGSTWTQGQEITATTPTNYAYFGSKLRLFGDRLAITAPSEDEPGVADAGAVYVFALVNGSWVFDTRFVSPTPVAYGYFGTDVAIDQNLVVVGSELDDAQGQYDSGAAFLFRKGKRPAWFFDDMLVASDVANYDHLGTQVAISNGFILVAADGNDTSFGSDSGVIYGYDRDEMTLSITPSDPQPGETMTFSAFRGAEGSLCMITVEDVAGIPLFLPLVVYVFAADHTLTFTADAPNPLFGFSVGMRSYKISSTGPIVFSELEFIDV